MNNWLLTILVLILVSILASLWFIDQRVKGSEAVLDVPEEECPTPIYTAHGDYALCIK